ncbi:hypothetical protein F7725_006129, partial [Dissostichus mawsoni]
NGGEAGRERERERERERKGGGEEEEVVKQAKWGGGDVEQSYNHLYCPVYPPYSSQRLPWTNFLHVAVAAPGILRLSNARLSVDGWRLRASGIKTCERISTLSTLNLQPGMNGMACVRRGVRGAPGSAEPPPSGHSILLMLGSPASPRKRPFELLSDLVDDGGFGEDLLLPERWDVRAGRDGPIHPTGPRGGGELLACSEEC